MPCPPCVGDQRPTTASRAGPAAAARPPARPVTSVASATCSTRPAPISATPRTTACRLGAASASSISIWIRSPPVRSRSIPTSTALGRLPGRQLLLPRPGPAQLLSVFDGVGTCPASGVCENGPIDGVCSTQTFRQCRSGTGTEDCEGAYPGAGTCTDQPRPVSGPTSRVPARAARNRARWSRSSASRRRGRPPSTRPPVCLARCDLVAGKPSSYAALTASA